ncbi:MAG: zf-HC2 domain-containing protein [Candidatus Cloacimonadota bacterium]|nr:zf-HC2 domain-containing protein [Candidatus Cloacimonadota bacterium]
MKCLDDKKILDYLNDDLNGGEVEAIKKHLQECSSCKKRYGVWEKTVNVTEEFVNTDIASANVPEFSKLINREKINFTAEKPLSSFQMWLKPALATAAVVILSLSYFLFPSPDIKPEAKNYLLTKNDYYQNELIEVNEINFTNIENNLLEEIYNDEESRNEILYGYGDYQIYPDQIRTRTLSEELSDQEIQYLKDEIDKMKTT